MFSSLINLDRWKNHQFRTSHIDPFLKQVLKHCRNIHIHLDAKELVPLSEIIEENLDVLENESEYQDKLLPLITDWFKSKFFSWFEPPSCEKCCRQLDSGHTYQNVENKIVEVYKCNNDNCDYKFEFIRHNDPAILLHTRQGRCGEWAMCFFIILRALDYDARLVYDSTDHVWNEVWSQSEGRWIHVDPCEGIVNTPFLYEAGWSKQLVYCLAFHQYEVLDVTGRYVLDYKQTLTRRGLCNEHWLREQLDQMTQELLKDVTSNEIRDRVLSRRAADQAQLKELTSKTHVAPTNLHSRRTGGLKWRIERGEYALSCKKETVIKASANREPSEDGTLFSFKYNCDRNLYESSDERYNSKVWSSLVYEYKNIDFKYERDWKTSYLARYESCPASEDGFVRWRFELIGLANEWRKLELLVRGKVDPDTVISLQLHKYDSCDSERPIETAPLELNETNIIERNNQQLAAIDLTAKLSGGHESDQVAWQRPQLFRQTRGQNAHEWSLVVRIL